MPKKAKARIFVDTSAVSAKAVAKQALAKVSKLAKKVGHDEVKHIYLIYENETPGTTAIVDGLNTCAQGVDEGQRAGDEIYMKKLYVNYEVAVNDQMLTTDNVRLAIVKDKENTGTAPGFADVFLGAGSSTMKDERTHYKKRYVVLKDLRISLDHNGKRSAIGSFSIPLNCKGIYNGTAGTDADLRENGIFLMVYGAQNTYKSAWNIYTHITFTDS